MSSDTNYDAFDTPILQECLESILIRPHTHGQFQQFQVGDVMLII